VTFAQLHRRGGGRPIIEIEAIARLKTAASGAAKVEYLNPEGLPRSPNYTQAIAVRSRRLVVSGGFPCVAETPEAAEKQAHETFRRLAKALESSGGSIRQVVFSQLFPVSDEFAALIRKVRVEYYDPTRPPASTMLAFQGAGVPHGVFVAEVTAPLPD
jgi:enamine deaminase RidA (YjgF/YER057c/UK114 family)